MKHIKILKIAKKNSTIMFHMVNFKTQEAYSMYFQVSFKNPWWLPKYEPNFGIINIPLYGWLFFSFGRLTEGIVCPTKEENMKIKDSEGNSYYLYRLLDRSTQDEIRGLIKEGGFQFELNPTTHNLVIKKD